MVITTDLCTDCVQIMTNPICPECLANQVLTWLRDKKISRYKLDKARINFRILEIKSDDIFSNTPCIICGKEKVTLCTFCFTNKARRIIEKTANPKIIENFNEDFNTKIWRI